MFDVRVKPKLNQILKEQGISQSELQRLTGVPQPFISRFDLDDRSSYNVSYLFLIADQLGLKIEDLFEVTYVYKRIGI